MDLYIIIRKNNRPVLFSPSDSIEACESESSDRIDRFISWLTERPSRLIAWAGRIFRNAHNYYVRLEDRIDPVERVLKAMVYTDRFIVYHSPSSASSDARDQLKSILKRQRMKHVFWLVLDVAVSAVVLVFTPFLAPIPGPNIFLYYPVLRLLSHYKSLRGAGSGLHSREIEFKCLPGLRGLEDNLQAPRFDRRVVHDVAERLKISGLEQFLERMV